MGLAGAAQANVVNVGSFFLDGFGATTGDFNTTTAGAVTSITLTGDAQQTGGFAFQTDTAMRITGPGVDVTFGPNFSTPPGNILWPVADPGSPQDSSSPQAINVTLPVAGAQGNYTVSFTNGYSFNVPGDWVAWDNVVVTFNPIPAPASLALLGLGGLAAGRRRR
jgi:hypothetical protein